MIVASALILFELALVPAVLLFFLEMSASLAVKRLPAPTAPPPFAVLVPAHDERNGIMATLQSIQAQLRPADRLVVVADNCSDDTAAIARQAGVTVTERFEPSRRGKGFALEHGVRFIEALGRYPVTIVVDADCLLGDGALVMLAGRSHAEQRPIQATYLMTAPPSADLHTRFAVLAFRLKNQARLIGGDRLGVPSLLTGSGMAFPTQLLAKVELGSDEIVEDLALGIALTRAGAAPRFCADALVTSRFPEARMDRELQRHRWERGYLSMIGRAVAPLLIAGLRTRSSGMMMLAADIAIPPLSILAGSVTLVLVVSSLAALFGLSLVPLYGAIMLTMLLAGALGVGWSRFGRDVISMAELVRMPFLIAAKLSLYPRMLSSRKPAWVRTARSFGPALDIERGVS